MTQFQIKFLGVGSAYPTPRHWPSAQVVEHNGNTFIIDAGEAVQLAIRQNKVKLGKINHIFISHMHGDHVLGLPGLISTIALLGKDSGSLTIHTFADGADIIKTILGYFCRETPFEIKYNILNPEKSETIVETKELIVSTFPLYHRVPCVGFLFKEKPKAKHLLPEKCKEHGVPMKLYRDIIGGADFTKEDGTIVPNSELTSPADPSTSYAYCSDTMYDERVAESIKGVDCVYHEATYANDYEGIAAGRGHSTASEAARIATLACAKQLILGHFSPRYENEDQHLIDAQAIFSNTVLSTEGLSIEI